MTDVFSRRQFFKFLIAFFLIFNDCFPLAFAQEASCQSAAFELLPAFLLTVGQDFALTLDDGRIIKLDGLDFPAAQDTPLGQATKQALQDWLEGVPLHLNILGAPDRWGRLPTLVTFAEAGTAQTSVLLQVRLLEAGFARFSGELAGDFNKDATRLSCAKLFQQREASARLQKQNLWQNPNFTALNTNQPASVWQEKLGRFILVEGVVASVGRSAGRVYLNFKNQAPRFPRFSVLVPPALVAKFEPAGAPALSTLQGQALRVRGILVAAGLNESPQPQIVLASPMALEPADPTKSLADLLLTHAPSLSSHSPAP